MRHRRLRPPRRKAHIPIVQDGGVDPEAGRLIVFKRLSAFIPTFMPPSGGRSASHPDSKPPPAAGTLLTRPDVALQAQIQLRHRKV